MAKTINKKRVAPSKRWCFTWNNYPVGTLGTSGSVVPLLQSLGKYIIGKEVGESGTPHLQGYIEFDTKTRALSAGLPKCIHWEKAKGNRKSNIAYCSKDGDYICHGFKVGYVCPKMKFSLLRPSQKAISCLFSSPEDPLWGRIIYWFWEAKGSWGKTITCTHLVDCRDAIILGGKKSDILCGVAAACKEGTPPGLAVFDIPRACGSRVSYAAIESVKNGIFFSGKYESRPLRFARPHCAVFANEPPESYANLSGDRWRVRNLTEWDALMNEIKSIKVRYWVL